MNVVTQMIQIYEANYPETLQRAFIINGIAVERIFVFNYLMQSIYCSPKDLQHCLRNYKAIFA